MLEDIILVGFGGHARSVADSIERQGIYRIIGYTDLEKNKSLYTYLGEDDVLEEYYMRGVRNAVISIGYLGIGDIRKKLYLKLKRVGFHLPAIIDPSAVISGTAKIEEGAFIGKGAVVNAESKIGKAAIINTKAVVEHECEVGDFAHVAVAAILCGQVKVGNFAFIGANATVIQCREIQGRQIVPAGIVVR